MKMIRTGLFASIPVALVALVLCCTPAARAQHSPDDMQGPPKYIYLSNVELKPGSSAAFAKLESEEIDALRAAKLPDIYFGMWSITGNTSRVLFLNGADSYADFQKMHEAIMGNAAVAAVLKKNNAAEGLLVANRHGSIYEYRKDLSLSSPLSLEQMRFVQITLFHVKSGKHEAFEHLVKEYAKAYQAAVPAAHWAMFEKEFGEDSGTTYLLVTPMKSLGDVDAMEAGDKTFMEKTGPDLMAMLHEAGPTIIASPETDLFAFGARISYVPDKWLTDSPDFWGKK
ncbi:MAG TPA: hypothetical protein VFU55_02260 [Terracidiphilus sp.]|nr:hypothetical protein [Terracidiphilus sp.]